LFAGRSYSFAAHRRDCHDDRSYYRGSGVGHGRRRRQRRDRYDDDDRYDGERR